MQNMSRQLMNTPEPIREVKGKMRANVARERSSREGLLECVKEVHLWSFNSFARLGTVALASASHRFVRKLVVRGHCDTRCLVQLSVYLHGIHCSRSSTGAHRKPAEALSKSITECPPCRTRLDTNAEAIRDMCPYSVPTEVIIPMM